MEEYDFILKEFGNYVKTKRYGRTYARSSSKIDPKADTDRLSEDCVNGSEYLESLVLKEIRENRGKSEKSSIPKGRKLYANEIERFCDLMDVNFTVGDKYITLTYQKKDVAIEEADKDFGNWIKRMRERYGDFKYLAVRSFQERGTPHFHLLATLPCIPKVQLQDGTFEAIWGHGTTHIERVRDSQIIDRYAKLKGYFIKNLKEFKQDPRSFGKRLCLKSNNLEEPKITRGMHDVLQGLLEKQNLTLKEIQRFDSDQCGFIERKTYRKRITE